MLNRKLLEVLNVLTPGQHQRLRLFLEARFFNHAWNAKELVQLYDYIMQFGADAEHPALSKPYVFPLFFPEKIYVENEKGPLDSMTTQLLSLVRRFIAQTAFEGNDYEHHINLAMCVYYRESGFEERFWQTVRQMRLDLDKTPHYGPAYFQKKLAIETEVVEFQAEFNSFQPDGSLLTSDQYLDFWYAAQKLENACAIAYNQKIKADFPIPKHRKLLQTVLELCQLGESLDLPPVSIFRSILDLLENPEDESAFAHFENLLKQHESVIAASLLPSLYAYYRFFWLQKFTNTGSTETMRLLFEVYREHFEKGYLYHRGKMPVGVYRMLVITALKLEQFEWVKQLLDNFDPDKIRGTRFAKEFGSLNLAEYHFYRKEYALAEKHLVYKPFENPSLYLVADVLQLKIYFETDEFDLLDFRVKALDQRVRRARMSSELKNRYFNFLKKIDKVFRLRLELKSKKAQKLAAQIRNEPNLIERDWLLEKLKIG